MANATKGETPLTLSDGRTLVLVLDMEALVQAEGAYGKPLAKLMGDAKDGFVGATRALLYGALMAKHPSIPLGDVTDMLRSDGDAVAAALSRAVELGFPDAKASSRSGESGGNAPKPRRGKTSGGSGAKQD